MRVIAIALCAAMLAGCAGNKEPNSESLTTATELGDFGPRNPKGTSPNGVGGGLNSGVNNSAGTLGSVSSDSGVFSDSGAYQSSGDLFGGGGSGVIGTDALGTGTAGLGNSAIGSGAGALDGGLGGSLGTTTYNSGEYDSVGSLDGIGGGVGAFDATQPGESNLFDTSQTTFDGGFQNYGDAGQEQLGAYNFPGDDGGERYFSAEVGSQVQFDTDSSVLSAAARGILRRQAAWLQLHPQVTITLEGHADERGTRSYNIALGARRANAARSYLTSLGVNVDRIRTVSYGKERPSASGSTPRAWAQNRRVVTTLRGGASF